MTEITSLVKQEADLYSVDPFLPGHESSLKVNQNNFGMDKNTVSVLKDSWIKMEEAGGSLCSEGADRPLA